MNSTSCARSRRRPAALSELSPEQRRPWDSAAAAKYVADLFLCLENLCRRRYRYLEVSVPTGPESHTRILEDFLHDRDLGGALDASTAERLKKYLRFRHRFTRGYGYDVSWEIVEEPLCLLPETASRLTKAWRNWLARQLDEDANGSN